MATDWSKKRDVFVFFISGAKEHNPAAAMALQEKLGSALKADAGGLRPMKPRLPAKKSGAAKKAPAKKK